MGVRIRAFIVSVTLLVSLLPVRAAAPPAAVENLYADAVSKEVAVHTALADANAPASVLKAVRTVVSDYEAIVRTYPSSGYADDALWRGGRVELDAFKKFGDPQDKDTALRLLHSLTTEYPSSKLARNVPSVLASLGSQPSDNKPPATPVRVATPEARSPEPATRLATIASIKREVLPDAVRVTIEMDAETRFHEERIDGPSRIFIDFTAAKTVASLQDKTLRFDGDTDPVHQIRFGRQPDNTTRVVLDAVGVGSYNVYPIYNPYRLVVDCSRAPKTAPVQTASMPLRPAAAPVAARVTSRPALPALKAGLLVADLLFPLAAPGPANAQALQRLGDADALDAPATVAAATPLPAIEPPGRNLAGGFSISRQLGLGVSRIVIDPGHGGHDPGAQGKGVSEAELALDISLRLERLLQRAGLQVVLTRRTDDFVPLQERTAIANREGADLFLSIHANASQDENVRGIETYYLNFASNMGAAAIAVRENAASGGNLGATPDFVKSIALNNKLDESRDLATDVQRAMIEKLRLSNKTVKDLGVKQAPFMVLIGASMPSVLAEISFVTNQPEAKLLQSSSYRDHIAEALFAAVQKYQASLRSTRTAQ
jgi:N-acetylmuramoyl-L-alanine amidase